MSDVDLGWTDAHDADLRRRLQAVAERDPVAAAWPDILRRLEPGCPHRRPIIAGIAAALLLVIALFAAVERHENAQVDTIDSHSTTTTAPGGKTSSSTTAVAEGDQSPPLVAGTTPQSSGRGDGPAAQDGTGAGSTLPGTSASTAPTTSTSTTTSTTAPEPVGSGFTLTVAPATVAPGGSITVESVTGCATPEWATVVLYLVEVWHDGTKVISDVPMQAPNGFTWIYEIAAGQAPGTYEVRAKCGGFRSPTDIPDIATYAPRTFTVTG